jgi:putative intracellular protease/amidase
MRTDPKLVQGRKVRFYEDVPYNGDWPWHTTELISVFKNAGAKVLIVGSGSQESYRGKRGSATVRVDATADNVEVDDFDAIIVPGGYAPDLRREVHVPLLGCPSG